MVRWLASNPDFVESYYSRGIYPSISKVLRFFFGWIPFSIGDFVYATLILLAIRYLILNRKKIRRDLKGFGRDIAMVLAVAYFTFYMIWGLNYYRQPIEKAFGIGNRYDQNELVQLTEKLISKTNDIHWQITSDRLQAVKTPYSKNEMATMALNGYDNLQVRHPMFKYQRPSLKKSVFSYFLTYMGYSGYLNPFTNEAQVNAKIPKFRYPFVSSHEVGHQIGYSAENETNFVGYLAATENEDIYFKYSAYTCVLGYCLNEIKINDEEKFNRLYNELNPGITKNYDEVANFWAAHENPLEPVFKSIFNTFLKANNQADGIQSYSKVVALLVNYHKRYPL